MDLSVCKLALGDWESYYTLAYYSHLIPVLISLFLGVFVLYSSKFSQLAKIFLFFILGFCMWLIGDLFTWVTSDFNLISALWSSLDFINIVFYALGAYFYTYLIREKDVTIWEKLIYILVTLPAWYITINGMSIVGFYQPSCEALNNDWLTHYKLIIENIVLGYIALYGALSIFKSDKHKRKTIFFVGFAIILFLLTFSSTEYIASVTGYYEMNLYSLFVLPVFLALIIFSTTNLKVFGFRSFGTQLLIYILLLMVGSQFFFLESVTNKLLTLLTFALSMFLGIVLARNIKKEEQMAIQLQIANEGQATLIHFINHQIKGYFFKARSIFAEVLEDDEYGPLNTATKDILKTGEDSIKEGVDFVQDILKASDIEKGTMVYNMEHLDFRQLVEETTEGQRKTAEDKGLTYSINISEDKFDMRGDKNQLKEAVRNLINNSISYTPSGNINISLSKKANHILFLVQDTGVGLSEEVKPKLFTKGGRDKESQKINVNSTGFGLSIVKGIVDAHHGRVWADSEGPGKGSTFSMELPVA